MKKTLSKPLQEKVDEGCEPGGIADGELHDIYSLMELNLLIAQGMAAKEIGWLALTTIPSLLEVPFMVLGLKETENGNWLVMGQMNKRPLDVTTTQEMSSLIADGLANRVFSTIGSLLLADLPEASGTVPEPLTKLGLRSALVVPVRTIANEFGVMVVGSDKIAKNYTTKQRFMVGSIANQVAVALENSSLIKQAQEAEERYRSTLDSMLEGCQIISFDWRYLYVNDASARHCHQTREEMLDHTVMEMFPGIENTEEFDTMQHCMEKRTSHHMKTKLTFPDGTKGWFEIDIHPVSEGIFVLSEDITKRKWAEMALRESEERFRTIFENANDVIIYLNKHGEVIEINEKIEDILGYRRDEIIGKNFLKLCEFMLSDVRRTIVGKLFKDTVRKGRVLDTIGKGLNIMELEIKHKDGYKILVEASSTALEKNGEIEGFLSILRDITERKRAEEKLRQSEEKYQMLFESSPDAIAQYTKEGRFLTANSAMAKSFGLSSDELVGKTIYDVTPREIAERRLQSGREAIDKNQGQVLEDESQGRYFHSVMVPIKIPGQEETFQVIARDITERKRAEELFNSLFNNAPVGIYIVQDGRFQLVNPQFQRLTGYSEDELLGADSMMLILPDDRNMVRKNATKMLKRERSYPYEYKFVNKSGETKWVMETVSSIPYQGRAAVLGSFMDITKRKRAEEELKTTQEYARNLVISSQDMIISVDRERRIVEFNLAAQKAFGYSKEEVLGKHIDILYADPSDGLKVYETALITGHFTGEISNKRKNSEIFPTSLSASVMQDANGEFIGIMGISRDITERKRAEEALLKAKEFSDKLITSMNDGFAVLDSGGVHTDVNPALCQMTGFSREEIVGVGPPHPYWPPEEYEEIERSFKKNLEGEFNSFELVFMRKNGERFPAIISPSYIKDKAENVVSCFATIKDITERKRAEEALKQRNIELSTLNTVARALSQYVRLGKMLQTALDSVLETMELRAGGIYLLDEDAGKLVLTVHKGFISEEYFKAVSKIPLGVGFAGKAAETGEVVGSTNLVEDELLASNLRPLVEQHKIQGIISVPLKSKGKTVGVIDILSHSPEYFPISEIQLLETIANKIGVAIENAKLVEKMSKLSITDELTGLYNRRHFYEVLETEMYRTQRYGRSFSLVMLDLDGFKEYNDKFGHTNGDAVLKSLAQTLQSTLRKSDIAFRYGGDEFAIILPATEANKAKEIVNRIRSEWLQMPKAHYLILETPLGFSAGIAQFPENAETTDGLVFLSDTALYHAKRQGGYRSRLVSELETLSPDILGEATLDQVYALAATVDAKDPHTYGHSKRVATISEIIGKAIGLPQKEMSDLQAASLLHDIGKLGVPDIILTKPNELTDDEWKIIRRHSIEGARIVGYVKKLVKLVPMILHHHEWYDGTGYPEGLKSKDIPLGARIISVADAYDTMTTQRRYRDVMLQEEAFEELRRCSGTQFDSDLVEAFCQSRNEVRKQVLDTVAQNMSPDLQAIKPAMLDSNP